MGSLQPLMAEALPCPPLSLIGRVPPANSPLSLDTQSAPTELTLWPVIYSEANFFSCFTSLGFACYLHNCDDGCRQ
jgi:hypothetical protein